MASGLPPLFSAIIRDSSLTPSLLPLLVSPLLVSRFSTRQTDGTDHSSRIFGWKTTTTNIHQGVSLWTTCGWMLVGIIVSWKNNFHPEWCFTGTFPHNPPALRKFSNICDCLFPVLSLSSMSTAPGHVPICSAYRLLPLYTLRGHAIGYLGCHIVYRLESQPGPIPEG